MEALKQIDLPWPSAGRAWELLSGSKVNLPESIMIPPSSSRSSNERNKRSAERSLGNEDNLGHRSRVPSLDRLMMGQNIQQGYYNNLAMQPTPPQTRNTPYYPPYEHERWGNVPINPNRFTSTGSLSTSVLPQQYSTGFIDSRGQSNMRGNNNQDLTGNRYSQYWNDYSALGQLDPTYGVPELPDPSMTVQTHQGSPVYMSAPYSLFSAYS